MTRSQRCFSLIIALTMVFSLFGYVYAGGEDSVREGYHQGAGPASSYHWEYKDSDKTLYIDFKDKTGSDLVQEYAADTVIDIVGDTQFIEVTSDRSGTMIDFPYFTSLKAATFQGDGTFNGVTFVNLRSSASITFDTDVFGFSITDYQNSSAPIINPGIYAAACYVTIGNLSSMAVNFPEDADSFAGYTWSGVGAGQIRIPTKLKTIPKFAFNNSPNVTSVIYDSPVTVTDIEYFAFSNCNSLTSITIPNTVKTIKPDAFISDNSLTDIYYGGTQAQWDDIEIQYISNSNIVYHKGLILSREVTLHFNDGSSRILEPNRCILADDMGEYVAPLSAPDYKGQVELASGIYEWEYYYEGILHINFVNSSTYPKVDPSNYSLIIDKTKQIFVESNTATFSSIDLPEFSTLEKIFFGKNVLQNVTIPDADELKLIYNASSKTHCFVLKGWEKSELPEIGLDKDGLNLEVYGSFADNKVTINEEFEKMSYALVRDPSGLKTATFEDGTETIPSSVLSENAKLENIKIPNSVTCIEYYAFSNCSSLKQIEIPSSVKKIRSDVFRNNENFTDIYYDGTKAEWNQIEIIYTIYIGAGPEYDTYHGLISKNVITVHCKDGDLYLPGMDDTFKITKPTPTPSVPPTEPPTEPPTQPPTQAPTSTATPTPTEEGFEAFVERLYTVALGRASEPEGKAFWCEHVGNGDLNGAQCANEFLLSKEFKDRKLSDEEFLKVLYRTFFDRDATADPDGFNFWMNSLKTQGRDTVVDCFINSTEWCNVCASFGVKSGATRAKATVPSKNAKDFADRLYTKCLGRPAEEEGLMFWALGLTNLELTGKQAAHEFFFSKEFNDHNYDDKELLTRMYRTFMGREPDDDGMNYWLKEMKNGVTKEQVFNSFVNSAEFTQICKDYAIERG